MDKYNKNNKREAFTFVDENVMNLGHCCSRKNHSTYKSAIRSRNCNIAAAKAEHDHHCAFYEAVELYVEWTNSN